MNVLKKR